jgi:hypothetical protein
MAQVEAGRSAAADPVAVSVLKREIEGPVVSEPKVEVVEIPVINWEPAPQHVAARSQIPLRTFEVEPKLATIDPPVAELIELDPSLAETPEVPAPQLHSSGREEVREPAEMPVPEDLDAPLPPPIERMPSILPRASHGVWPHATSLIHQLESLAKEFPSERKWAGRVIAELERLSTIESLSSDDALTTLRNLHMLAEEVSDDSAPQAPTRDRTLRLRAGYAIARRLAVWDNIYVIASGRPPAANAPFNVAELAAALHQIDGLLAGAQSASHWNKYLRLAELRSLAKLQGEPNADQRALARDVLRRIDSPRLDQRQHLFLASEPFCQLAETLQPMAQDAVDWAGLIGAIERHEADDTTLHTHRVAEMLSVMRWSTDERVLALAQAINDNYRNANVRVAAAEELINRFIPAPQIMAEPVVDNIRGADVVGRSESLARLRVVLLPDPMRWKLGLDVHGSVASETESSKGPARFWNDGLGAFSARKLIMVDRRGLVVDSARAHATAESHLTDFETNFDSIPLFGALARSIARQQYEHEQPAARSEIESKISARARQQLNVEVDRRIVQAEREFQTKLIEPLDRLNLEPTAVAMETTPRRLVVRYRLAGPHQLSAHTPRPQAPGNSMLSLQLHDSVMNNSLENLQLDGRRVNLRTLYVEMLRRFAAPEIKVPDDLPEDVSVHFAERDAIRVTCESGRVRLTIRLQELNHADKNVWKNLVVHGYYRPSDNQLAANLVRDGNIELSGERLRLGDQIALRGIFAKVLSRNRQLSLVNKQLLSRPELADLQVTQFVIQDGWIGVAIGPKSDNLRPAPSTTPDDSDENHEVARRPLRTLIHALR